MPDALLLLFALLATPIMTVLGTWSHLLGGSDYLQDERISALAQEGLPLPEALMQEWQGGRACLADALRGAARLFVELLHQPLAGGRCRGLGHLRRRPSHRPDRPPW